MERLTFEGIFCDIAQCFEVPTCCDKDSYCSQRKVWERLKQYEDMEEQGRLVVLPCKVGDRLYITETRIYNYEEHKGLQLGVACGWELNDRYGWVAKVELDEGEKHTRYFYNLSNFGKTVFLTREEAEAALRKEGADNAIT